MNERKQKISELVEAINLVLERKWKKMEVDLWAYGNVYVWDWKSKLTMFYSMNYGDVVNYLKWYLDAIN